MKKIKLNKSDTCNLPKKDKEHLEKVMFGLCIKWYRENFPEYMNDLNNFTVEINNRFTKCYGLFRYHTSSPNKTYLRNYPVSIIMSGKSIYLCKTFGSLEDYFQQIVVHELIHLHLFFRGDNFHDGDPIFESYLVKYNTKSSGLTPKEKQMAERSNLPKVSHVHTCGCKGRQYNRRTKNKTGLMCGTCYHTLKYEESFVLLPE